MLNATSTKYLEMYCQQLAKDNEVADVSKQFNIAPPMETKLRQGILQSVGFLGMLAAMPVDQIKGQVVDVGNSGLITGRKTNDRFYAELGQGGHTYELTETDSGVFITWEMMTQWANSGSKNEWAKLMNNAITRNLGLDTLRIGFHGTHVAAGDTDPTTYPLGQDVNKGWLTIVKEKAPAQVLASATLDPSGQTAGSYKNLDSLANDLENTVIHEVFQGDDELVILVGRDLVAAEQHRLLESADKPTEHKAAQSLAKTINGRKVYTPPFFPPKAMWITTLKNLQVLTQKGTQWRKSRNEEDRKRFETSYLRMEGYGVGRFEKFAAIEQVDIVDPNPAP